MRLLKLIPLPLLFFCHVLLAQTPSMSSAQSAGFNADTGQASTASSGINLTNAQKAIPSFTGTPPSELTSGYAGTSLYPQGSSNIVKCNQVGYKSGGTQADGECNASVTLQGNTNYQKFSVTDPILQVKPNTSAVNTALGAGTSSNTCAPVVTTTPEVAQQKTCNDYIETYVSSCSQILNPACVFQGGPISAISTSGQGASQAMVSTGLYNYSIGLGGGGIGWPQTGAINFNLDGGASRGSYISVNSNNLDDTAVVVVNNVVVYFGHPNSGGQWYYPSFGTDPVFQYGYSWSVSYPATNGYDVDGNYYSTPASTGTESAQFLLSNTCPAGISDYSNKTGKTASWCNQNGQWVGNTVEGNGYRSISISANLPIVSGANSIQLFWGNEYGNYGGGITLSGEIYNVIPVCSTTNNCQAQEGLLPK